MSDCAAAAAAKPTDSIRWTTMCVVCTRVRAKKRAATAHALWRIYCSDLCGRRLRWALRATGCCYCCCDRCACRIIIALFVPQIPAIRLIKHTRIKHIRIIDILRSSRVHELRWRRESIDSLEHIIIKSNSYSICMRELATATLTAQRHGLAGPCRMRVCVRCVSEGDT